MAAGGKSLALLLPWFVFLASCALAPMHLQVQQSGDLANRRIKRIAAMGVSSVPDAGRKLTAKEVGAAFNRSLYLALTEFQDWEVVSEREIEEMQAALPADSAEEVRARKLGEMVHADAIVFGRVHYFSERVGEERGVTRPASVTFALNLVDVKRGDVAWKANYEETQRPLSDNLFAIATFAERGARWLKAEELAQEGIQKAVRDLHRRIFP